MNIPKSADDQIEQIQDLDEQGEEAQSAEQVKGGFNPQPDPPRAVIAIINPVYRPPVFNPSAGY